MAAAPPITSARPTNREIAEGVNAAHDCIHSVGKRVDNLAKAVGQNRDDSVRRDAALGERMARIEGALGVNLPSKEEMEGGAKPSLPTKRFAGLSQWQAIATIGGAMFSALTAYKFIEPAVAAGFAALHHALMTAH